VRPIFRFHCDEKIEADSPHFSSLFAVFALRTLRELKLLRYFAEQQVSENIISIVDIIKPSSLDSFKEVSSNDVFSITSSI